VHHRVQTDPSQQARGVVAEHARRPGMHELMNGNSDDEGDDDRDKESRIEVPESRH
jgi:hypothetical protein